MIRMTSRKPSLRGIYTISIVAILMAVCAHHDSFTQTDEYATVSGQVIDHETKEPIPDVNIIVHGTRIGTSTNEIGEFTIDKVPVGIQTLQFSHINYILHSYKRKFSPGITSTINIEMISRIIIIDEVEVVDTIPEHHTPRSPTGYYFSKEDIERSGAITFGGLIQSLVPRVRIRETAGNLYIQLQYRSTIDQRYDRAPDPHPLIVVNGMRIGTSPIGLAGILHPSDIEHLEIIRPPESQSLYGLEATYGAIVVETRDGSGEEDLLTTAQKVLVAGGLATVLVFLNVLFIK